MNLKLVFSLILIPIFAAHNSTDNEEIKIKNVVLSFYENNSLYFDHIIEKAEKQGYNSLKSEEAVIFSYQTTNQTLRDIFFSIEAKEIREVNLDYNEKKSFFNIRKSLIFKYNKTDYSIVCFSSINYERSLDEIAGEQGFPIAGSQFAILEKLDGNWVYSNDTQLF